MEKNPKNRHRNISAAKHDYRKKPMVLLGWGLASDFDVYSDSRRGWFLRVLPLLFAVALLVMLAVIW